MATTRPQTDERLKLRQWFGEIPVKDARRDLHIQINEKDIKTAVKGDPENCVFSRACQRAYGSRSVVFFGTVAYVDVLNNRGNRQVERYLINKEGRDLIKRFDKGNKVSVAGFKLLGIPAGSTTEAKRKYMRKYMRDHAQAPRSTTAPKRRPSHSRFDMFIQPHSAQAA